MEMDKELLEILACPKCKGELQLTVDESELRCKACRLSYRIDDGIQRNGARRLCKRRKLSLAFV